MHYLSIKESFAMMFSEARMTTQESGSNHIILKKLRTEYLENPLGIDLRRPSLSWQIDADGRNVMQGAYQIQAAQSLADLEVGKLLWDSGSVASEQSTSIRYEGPEGHSTQRIHWRVRMWDQDGKPSDWSEPAWWEMGLLEEQDWAADWIEVGWDEDPKAFKPCPYFRRSFILDQLVKSARLYITAHGLYEAWLNGQRVGDQVFTPGYTAYDKRLQYQIYDVTALLQKGDYVLGVILGDGWYRGKIYINSNRNVYGTRLALLAQLSIENDEGHVLIGSDGKWKATTGPIIKSDMRDGETYDARLEMAGWCNIGYDDSAWKPVRVVPHPKNHIVVSMGVPVRRKEIFHPKVIKTPMGETVLDFGQNLSGVVHMKVRGTKGTTIRLRHGESLDKDSNFTILHLFVPEQKDMEKTPEFQEVRYTLKGEGEEEYEPHFTVHGFRYAKLEGYPGEPRPEDFYAVAIYSDMVPTGTFECSDLMINQLHHNAEWSMKGNFLDLPTDCPTRERAGWTGDAQIFTPSASFLMDTQAFFSKWLTELRDEQFPNGMVGNFVPNPYRLVKGTYFKYLDGSSGWGDVAVIMPWSLYNIYGDVDILKNQYESMKSWVGFVQKRARKVNWLKRLTPRYWFDKKYRAWQQYIWDTGYHWGEWLEPGQGSPSSFYFDFIKRFLRGCPAVATAYFANSAHLLAKTAEILGKNEDAHKYHALADQVKAAYVEEFIGPEGRIRPHRQASYVRVLVLDLAPDELKPAIVEHLVQLIMVAGNHIGTGFLSTPFLCHVLSDNGHLDLAYDLLNQKTIPSWLYEITKGATTIWETWEGINEEGRPQLSLNHYSPGSVINFLHRKVAGLDAAEPGYHRIAIHPLPGGGLTHARAVYESVHGLIISEWMQENDRMQVNITIPANTRATVTLPGALVEKITESGIPLLKAEGMTSTAQVGKDTQVELGSGAYHFEYPTLNGN
jgi:alpha-L-rhamnosidase